jgi:hypothetical protein
MHSPSYRLVRRAGDEARAGPRREAQQDGADPCCILRNPGEFLSALIETRLKKPQRLVLQSQEKDAAAAREAALLEQLAAVQQVGARALLEFKKILLKPY